MMKNFDDPEFVKKFKETQMKDFENDLVTSDKYYLDLALLKDFNAGVFLYKLSQDVNLTEEQKSGIYSYFIKNSVPYMKRVIDEIDCYLHPDFKLTQDEVLSMMRDPQYSETIFNHSPNTKLIHSLKSNIAINVNHSIVKDKYKKVKVSKHSYVKKSIPIWFYINTYPLTLSQYTLDIIANEFCNNFKVNVKFLNKPIFKLKHTEIDHIDEFYIYCLQDFQSNDYVNDQMLKGNFYQKRMFAAPFFKYELKNEFFEKQDKEYTTYQYIESRFSFITQFDFLKRSTLNIFGKDAHERK